MLLKMSGISSPFQKRLLFDLFSPSLFLPMATVSTTDVFQKNLFAGRVLLCSGGGSGICRGMTEAMVRHGAKAVIVSRT